MMIRYFDAVALLSIKEYIEGGVERVMELNFYRLVSDLEPHRAEINAHLISHPPASVSEACGMIQEVTGIKRGMTQTRNFLKSSGFSYRKTAAIPSKAGTEEKNEQWEFLEKK